MNKLFFLILVFIAVSCQSQETKLLSQSEFKKAIQANDILLIDVRTKEEFIEGHISNALNIDYNGANFEQEIAKLDKTKAVYLYCHSGRRSANAASKLNELGFKKVFDLEGGFSNWKE